MISSIKATCGLQILFTDAAEKLIGNLKTKTIECTECAGVQVITLYLLKAELEPSPFQL